MIIKKQTFKNKDDIITSFTAEWCNPCKKIKHDFMTFIKNNDFEEVSSEDITKEEYKKTYMYIPGFTINGSYIQTSDITLLTDHIKKIINIKSDKFLINDDF